MPRYERRLIEQPRMQVDEHTTAIGSLLPNEIVHNFRILRNWTQDDAARWWGCNVRTWRRWETPGGKPKRALLLRIKQWAHRSCPEYVHLLT
jgi:DNA-binding transcriptional regulator YiaG